MPGQPRTGAVERSEFATTAGVPWWGALLIAATATLVGIGIEAGSGHQELGGIFAGCYALGCLAAVLAVRRSGIFTAVIQPPLVLFVAVPLAYYLFHESSFGGLKDALVTCGYPLIERFPLMLFTSAAVLLIGLVRWYRVMNSPGEPQPTAGGSGLLAGLSTKLASAFAGNGSVDEDPGTRPARPRHVADRQSGGGRARRPQQSGAARGRHSRPAPEDFADAPRRRTRDRRAAGDAEWAPDPRRLPRDPRRAVPPPRRDPRERRESYDPRERRTPPPRFDPYESDRGYRPDPRYGAYPPYEPRRRPAPDDREPSHHPISRVRYRDPAPRDADADGPRNRPRR